MPDKQLLAVTDHVIGTLFPVGERKQLWLLRNFVPISILLVTSSSSMRSGNW